MKKELKMPKTKFKTIVFTASENYKESVFRREKIMATDLGNNIAIPHGSEKEIIKSKIVIAT
mgnify:CR=1 FL=1